MTRLRRLNPLLLLLSALAIGCSAPDPEPVHPGAPADAGVQADAGAEPQPGCDNPCADACCSAEQICASGVCTDACVPSCEGKQCGDDNCGGTCGTCGEGSTCTADQCVAECVPNCEDKHCGDDGCGGSCGVCGGLLTCGGSGAPFRCGKPPSECSADGWCGVASGTIGMVSSVWGPSADDVFAVSQKDLKLESILLKWTGSAWAPAPGGHLDAIVVGIHGNSATDLWLAAAPTPGESDGLLARYDGAGVVSTYSVPNGYAGGVHALSEDAAIAVGIRKGPSSMDGFVRTWDGSAWTELTLPDAYGPLYAVWANSIDDFWVAGEDGVVLHHEAGTWTSHSTGKDLQLMRAWGSGPDDVWFVGDLGLVAHWNGTALETLQTNVTHDLYGVSGTSPNDVWIVGDFGTVLHWNGTSFSRMQSGTTDLLSSVWAASSTDVWAVGGMGTILRYQP